MKSLLENIPKHIPEEIFESLVDTENVRIERIISKGHSCADNDWYDQPQHEWIVLMQGSAKLLIEKQGEQTEDTIIELNTGDYYTIPAHVRHRVIWTDEEQPTVWLAVHYGNLPS